MKKTFILVSFLLVAFLISACKVTVTYSGDSFMLDTSDYVSEYSYQGHSVICDDRSTLVTVFLTYRGEVESVETHLLASGGGSDQRINNFSPNSRENENGRIEYSFSVARGTAPLSSTSLGVAGGSIFTDASLALSSQAIVVRPVDPETIGYTQIELFLRTSGSSYRIISRPIRVLNFC